MPEPHVETRPNRPNPEETRPTTATRSSAEAMHERRSERLPPDKPPPIEASEAQCDDPSPWDVVDEASWESFPASDPPSYSGGSAGTKR